MAKGRRTRSARGVGHGHGGDSACRVVLSSHHLWSTCSTEREVQGLLKRFDTSSNGSPDLRFWKQENDCDFSWFLLVAVVSSLQTPP